MLSELNSETNGVEDRLFSTQRICHLSEYFRRVLSVSLVGCCGRLPSERLTRMTARATPAKFTHAGMHSYPNMFYKKMG